MAVEREQINAFKNDYAKTVVPNYTVAGPGPLNEREKILQKVILNRDFYTLFRLIPLAEWNPRWQMGKYSFVDRNGVRKYIPWTKQDLANFIYSPYYTTQPGYVCPESQLDQGLVVHWGKQQVHALRYPSTDWKHIWPMYPGGGYPGQTFGCEKYRPSTWVKIRKKVYGAVAIVAAIYLGPIVMEKVGAFLAGGAEGAAAGTGATATQTSAFVSKVNNAVQIYNKANTVKAIVNGELPPPPIGISGKTFTDMALNVAKDEIKKAAIDKAMEEGVKYIQKKMTEKEEAKIRAEIMLLQTKMDKLIPAGTPIGPSPELNPEIRNKISEIQTIQAKREQETVMFVGLGLVGGALLLAG